MSGCWAANSKRGTGLWLNLGISCPHFKSDTGKRVVVIFVQNVQDHLRGFGLLLPDRTFKFLVPHNTSPYSVCAAQLFGIVSLKKCKIVLLITQTKCKYNNKVVWQLFST